MLAKKYRFHDCDTFTFLFRFFFPPLVCVLVFSLPILIHFRFFYYRSRLMSSSPIAIHHILVHGKVQGVFYRKYTQKEAVKLLLTGWVRNLPSGSVEIVAEGPLSALRSLEKWCYQGSPKSKVKEVVIHAIRNPSNSTNSSSNSVDSKDIGSNPERSSPSTSSALPASSGEEITRQYVSFDILR